MNETWCVVACENEKFGECFNCYRFFFLTTNKHIFFLLKIVTHQIQIQIQINQK